MIKESEWIPGSNTRQNKTKSLIDASLINNSIFLIYWLNMGPTVHICHLYTFHHPHPLTQEADITYKNNFPNNRFDSRGKDMRLWLVKSAQEWCRNIVQ